jgi:hypothetical protein
MRRPRLTAADRSYHYDLPSVADEGASEIAIQKSCRDRVARQFPGCVVVAVPNAGKRSRWAAGRVRAEGLSKGFPDMMVLAPGRIAFVEVKAKGALDAEQHDWLEALHGWGHPCGVFRSQDSLAAKLTEWGFPRAGTP